MPRRKKTTKPKTKAQTGYSLHDFVGESRKPRKTKTRLKVFKGATKPYDFSSQAGNGVTSAMSREFIRRQLQWAEKKDMPQMSASFGTPAGPQSKQKPGYVSGLRPTKETGTNPKDAFGDAKVPLGYVAPSSLFFQAQAMSIGAPEYGPYNWRVAKVQALVYLSAAYRHLTALLDGEDYDPKTGYHHGGFIQASIGIYLDAMVTGQLIDNRPVKGATGALLQYFVDMKDKDPLLRRQTLEHFLRGVNQAQSIREALQANAKKEDKDGE